MTGHCYRRDRKTRSWAEQIPRGSVSDPRGDTDWSRAEYAEEEQPGVGSDPRRTGRVREAAWETDRGAFILPAFVSVLDKHSFWYLEIGGGQCVSSARPCHQVTVQKETT